MSDRNKAIARRLLEEMNGGRLELIDELCSAKLPFLPVPGCQPPRTQRFGAMSATVHTISGVATPLVAMPCLPSF
jgi:hypothetical protein